MAVPAEKIILKTNIIIGDGLEEAMKGFKRAFVVCDSFLCESGRISYVTDRLGRAGVEYKIFSDIHTEPDIDTITKIVGQILDFEPDAVIAFGGGSALDAGKAAQYFAHKQGGLAGMTCFAIPTTSGTGSEMTSYAVISDPAEGRKYPLIDDSLLPANSILDAQLTMSLPPAVTANTGMDVFTHALEALVSKNHNDLTDALAEKSIWLIREYLYRAYVKSDDRDARQGMHHASCLAGIAFNSAGLGINHSLAHALGGEFHIPHGRANAILLPYVIAFNADLSGAPDATTAVYAKAASILGLDVVNARQGAMALLQWVRRFKEKLGIPATIHEAGIEEKVFADKLPALAEAALADRCTPTNPRAVSAEQLMDIYKRAYSGRI